MPRAQTIIGEAMALTDENAKKLNAVPAHMSLSNVDVKCEECGTSIPFEKAYSMAAVYRMPGLHPEKQHPLLPYQCELMQHFGCSHEHAFLALIRCLFEHIHTGDHAAKGQPLTHDLLVKIQGLLEQKTDKTNEKDSAAS